MAEVVRFSPGHADAVEVFGVNRGSPLIGDDLMDREPLWGYVGFDPELDDPPLLGLVGLSMGSVNTSSVQFTDQGEVTLLDSTFAEPLSENGRDVYRYRSGVPLTVEGPEPLSLLSVEFETRDSASMRVVGIVWFDSETGAPVKTMLRPRTRRSAQQSCRARSSLPSRHRPAHRYQTPRTRS